MRSQIYLLFFLTLLVSSCMTSPKHESLKSPNDELQLLFSWDKELTYQLSYQDQTVTVPSALGFALADGTKWHSDLLLQASYFQTAPKQGTEWAPVYGERKLITDHYNEMAISLVRKKGGTEKIELIFRLYDEGLAFRYKLHDAEEKQETTIKSELTSFSFAEDVSAWVSSRAQSEITRQKISEISDAKERPLVLELREDLYAAIGEAGLVDFARMKFTKDTTREHTLKAELASEATVGLPYATPWRYIMIGESPGELLENNYFLLNLNEPNKIKDASWIKPGKVIREVTLTTQGGMACVDFAAENGLQYVEFDAGWYGPEYETSSDARTITVDPKRSPGPLELQKVIDYAETKGIGILVYVNRRALEQQLDEILPLYRSWGIKGVKYGFVQVGSQKWTDWLHRAVRKAAENQLMVDIHDEYRPTGYSRTYPNLMTQEGIRGDEESPSTAHTLTTLFTRMIAGAGDNTICYYAPRVTEKMGGHAAQLAKAVLLYSPWQFVYWYDRPQGSPHKKGGAGASTGIIGDDPELAFFAEVPTVWDETKVVEGAIGRFATIARKSGDRWFIGSLSAEDRAINIPLEFLDADRSYEATIYSDDPKAAGTTKVGIKTQVVDQSTPLSLNLKKDRGLAILIQPKS